MAIQAPKGTKDVLPQDSFVWQHFEAIARESASLAGFGEIRTPVFEHTELFLRGVGDTTDVVQKEMYTFEDKGKRSITLKPEGTAGTVRALIESGLAAAAMPQKLFYLNCPVFRYENPQSGRLREHHQFGVEAFGCANAEMDAEIVSVALSVLKKIGLQNLSLNINSIGCAKCRGAYQDALRDYLRPHLNDMCETCRERFERNPLRILDCKEEGCKAINAGAPSILDYLCDDCNAHFERFKALLTKMGVPYCIDPGIVRGLDYYTRTVFEIITTVDGRDLAICAGGRYDKLVKTIGGPDLPGVGFGMGLERLIIVAQEQGCLPEKPAACDIYLCTMGEKAKDKAFDLVHALREKGVRADMDMMDRSLKAQFKYCGKAGIDLVATIGEDELAKGVCRLRDMKNSTESEIALDALLTYFD